jgi:hypothetical protein
VGLVEGDPVTDFGKSFEHDSSVMFEVGNELLLAEEAAVCLLESIGEVPVKKGDHGRDTGVKKIVHEFYIVVDTCLADGVLSSSFGDDP